VNLPPVCFDHLATMTTDLGLYEHARLARARRAGGYCLDDVARALVLTARHGQPTNLTRSLTACYLSFVEGAHDGAGRFRNRRRQDGSWAGPADTKDHWGRALWGLGTTAAAGPTENERIRAGTLAEIGLAARSPSLRAMAYAAVGAFEILQVDSGNRTALQLLYDTRELIGRAVTTAGWPWLESHLAYANAVIPEAMLVIGAGLGDDGVLQRGLDLLGWLVDRQTLDGHLSVVPVGGWRPGDTPPEFDQQPIEVSALAEAARRALLITGASRWARVLDLCAGWFLGANDCGLALYDPGTGAGFDGLLEGGVNRNQGAESTLAALSTLQLAHLTQQVPAR
jgi:hypothetical protein